MSIHRWPLSKSLLLAGVSCFLLGLWLMAPDEANSASVDLNPRPRAETTLRFVPTASGPYMIGISDGLGKGTYRVQQDGRPVPIRKLSGIYPCFDAVAGKSYDVAFTMPKRVPSGKGELAIEMSYEETERVKSQIFMWRAPVVLFLFVAGLYGFAFWLELKTRKPHRAS